MKKINIKTARANKINHSTEMVFILDRSGSMAGLVLFDKQNQNF